MSDQKRSQEKETTLTVTNQLLATQPMEDLSNYCIKPRVFSLGFPTRKLLQYFALLLFAFCAGSAVAGKTQEVPTTTPLVYNDGDLFLGFRATDRTNDYLVNIGQPTPFVTAAPGSSFQVVTGNLSTDLIATFGADWYTRVDPGTAEKAVHWAIVGGRQIAASGDAPNTLYSTNPDGASWPSRSDTAQGFTSSLIAAMGNTFAGNNPSPNNAMGLVQSAASSNSYASFQPGGPNSNGISFQAWNPWNEHEPAGTLFFDRIAAGACGTTLGSLTLSSGGVLNFSALSIPTPISIAGKVSYCSNPGLPGVPNVTITVTGSMSGSTLTDSGGNFTLSSLPSGGNFNVTPSKAGLAPATTGINTVDVIAIQRHFLNLGPPLVGCRLTAADVNGVQGVNTVDVIATQRFFLGLTTGVANVGKYQFNPLSRTYFGVFCNRSSQNFDALVFGDVTTSFVHRPGGSSDPDAPEDGSIASAVAGVALPEGDLDTSSTNFVAQVATSYIDATTKLVGFQGDFTFDERVVTFEREPVQNAGLTRGNWNVSGNILPGRGPIRTLRVSAFSNDFTPLSGKGTLFELRVKRIGKEAQGTELRWAAPPDQFIFIDADLNIQEPSVAPLGVLTISANQE